MLYFIVLCITLCITLVTMVKAFENEDRLVWKAGMMLFLSTMITFGYIIASFVDSRSVIILAKSIIYVCITLLALLGVEYVVSVTRYEGKIIKILKRLFYVLSVADVVVLLGNPYWRICVDFNIDTSRMINVIETVEKLPFKLHIAYVYTLILISLILLIKKCMATPKIYWYKYHIIVIGTMVTVVVNCVFLFNLADKTKDISAVFYAAIALVLYENAARALPYGISSVTRKLMVEYMGIPVVLFDIKDCVMDYNASAETVFGKDYLKRESTSLKEILFDNKMFTNVSIKNEMECEWVSKEAKPRIFNCVCKRIRDNDNESIGRILILKDITAQKEAYSELEYSVIYDSLTGLYNRYSLKKKVVELNKLKNQSICVGICNINGMKTINDLFGSQRGDEVTVEFARVLQSKIDESSFLAKVEDGNFIVVFFGVNEEEAGNIFEEIRQELANIDIKDIVIDIEYGLQKIDKEDMSVESAIQKAKSKMQNKKSINEASNSNALMGTLKNALNEVEFETEEHLIRTKALALKLGGALQLDENQMRELELLTVLHDIGKIAIPEHILTKPSKLTEEEWEIMKEHPIKGYRIVKATTELAPIAEYVLTHHERWDGSGYPSGIKGVNIPLLSRVIAIIDAYDAMTHDRPYHKALSRQEALEELKRCAGTQFDPAIVDVFLSMGEDI